METKIIMPKKVTIGIQVVNMMCECGGMLINYAGSTMIDGCDDTVSCEQCGALYKVPANAFTVREFWLFPQKKENS